ncbi:hypothetical protein PQB35_gp08 [Ochrobactrum phage vB_OspP_OH]|uniref:Uncharacterized protein n=1 Tax=Ochrobactrum phage vB_OspP_OH TaxID=2712957 RepID=A0A6G6XXK9_9CAUD|nr:hypothetical protein PQB35_gp08 [Ochrobactrum phage vB_OspP_OH]QIG66064.1 hypothetical protein phiOH_p08 [Ochrobactrum phage vB_OspP_OH]
MTDDQFSHLPDDLAEFMRTVAKQPQHNGQFAPKLSHADRMGIYAAAKTGTNLTLLALVFGVNRRTITHMVSDTSKAYGPVKREYIKLGHTDFVNKYLTEAIAARIMEGMNNPEIMYKVSMTTKQLDAEEAARRSKESRAIGPNPKANNMQGTRTIKGQDGLSHRYEIGWLDSHPNMPEACGWFIRCLDSSMPDFWQTGGERTDTGFWTSIEAYNYIRDNAIDGTVM